jgi:gliding motility-associated-like protein
MADFETYNTNGLSNSGVEDPECGGSVGSDIWFEVTVSGSGYINIVTLPGTMSNAAMAIYTGTCNNLTEFACTESDNCGNSDMPIWDMGFLTPGTTFFIRIWRESGSNGTFDILIADAPSVAPLLDLQPTGDAYILSPTCVQLTVTSPSQEGCAWDPTLVDFTQPFSNNVLLNFGTINGNGADGICMVYQNDADGLGACGIGGGQIGGGGIDNSFIIEFDTWDNGPGFDDIGNDHVSVDINGDMMTAINGPYDLGNIEDGLDHEVLFTWDPVAMYYEIYFDGNLTLSGTYDIVANCFGGVTEVYCGFVSSTGGSSNNQSVCSVPPINYPSGDQSVVEVQICEGDSYFAGGSNQTTSGNYNDVFSAYNGCDSVITTQLTVNPTSYSFLDEEICVGDCFFVAGTPFCSTGVHEVTIQNYLGCDSVIQLTLMVIAPEIIIEQPDPITCANPTITLDASNSISGADINYQWTGPNASCLVGDINSPTVEVSCPGIYTFIVFQDIGVQTCVGMQEVIVTEYIIPPTANIAPPNELSCSIPCTVLDASGSDSGPPFIAGWTGPGSFGSNELNPTVCEPGVYLLTITNEDNGCTDTMSVVVSLDDATPFADAGLDALIDCQNETVTLDGSNSSQGSDFLLQWEDVNNTVLGTNTTLEVSEPGTYIISVFNQANGCLSTDEVIVTADNSAPNATIVNPGGLDCATTSIVLDGSGSSSTDDYEFSWQTPLGTEVGVDTLLGINNSGTYFLIINNLTNGCSDTTSTVVTENTDTPIADPGMDQNIDCATSSATFDGSNSSGTGNLTFQWLDENNIEIGTDTMVQVTNPGNYFLVVVDSDNSCVDTTGVSLSSNSIYPIADAGLDTLVNCSNPEIDLSISGSDTGMGIEYEWQDETGGVLGSGTTLSTDSTGSYTLIVTNTNNGCSSSDIVDVGENFIPPSSDAGMDVILDCISNSVLLDGSNSQQGATITYEWEDGNNNPIGTGITFQVNSADTYTIVVTDTTNGCSSSDIIEVTQEIDAPTADAGSDMILDCNTTMVTLDGGNSTSGPNIMPTWSNEAGDPLGSSLQLQTNLQGTYSLTIFNTLNGCTSVSNAVVNLDTIAPSITASPDVILNCFTPATTIGTSLAIDNPDWTFNWEDQTGASLAATDTLPVASTGTYTLFVTNTSNACQSDVSTLVTEDFAAPTANAGNDETLTCTTTDITLDASNSDNGPNFSAEWQNSLDEIIDQTTSVSINEAGTYTFFVTNLTNGCMASDEAVIAIDTLAPVVDSGPGDTLTCTTTSVLLDGANSTFSVNATLSWTNESDTEIGSNLTQTVNLPGTYNFTIINLDNGCVDSNTVEVLQNTTLPDSDAGPDVVLNCFNPTNTLTINNSSNGSNFTYEWQDELMQPVSTQTTLGVSFAQTYTLIVTDTENGCVDDDMVEITENFTAPQSDAGGDILLDCQTTENTLGGPNTSIGASFDYQWNSSGNEIGTQITQLIDEAGVFELIVFDNSNGCSDTSNVEVTVDQEIPFITGAVNELLTCVQLTAILDATGTDEGTEYDYNWSSISGGPISPGVTDLTPFVGMPGTYQMIITNNDNQCTNTIEFTVLQDIEPPLANAGQDFELNCHAPVSNLDGNLSYPAGILEFEWSTADGQFESATNISQPTISFPGTYLLSITNTENGCTDTDIVGITSNFITGLDVEIDNPLCHDETGSIIVPEIYGGSPPFLYSIDGGENFFQSNLFTNVAAGSYEVVIQDSNECQLDDSALVNAPAEVVITLDAETEILQGETYSLYAITNLAPDQIDTIIWSPAETLSCTNCLTPVAFPLVTTDYQVQVIDINGCAAQTIQRVNVDRRPNVYVPNVFSPNGDGNNDIFMIFSNFKSVAQVNTFRIYNRWGEPVYEAFGFPTNNAAYGWDGLHRGKPANAAVFVWYAEVEMIDGRVILYKGDVALVR